MPNQLFENPPHGVIDVFSTACTIAKENWKTLGLIAIFQLLSLIGAALVLGLITFLVAATYIMTLIGAINKITGGDIGGFGGRSLLDYSVGVHGASRLLDEYGNNDFGDMDDDFANLFSADTIFVILGLWFLWMFVLSLITSLYAGTFYHALASIYTGGFPSVRESMGRGVARMWSVYFFSLLYTLSLTGLFILMVGLPIKAGSSGGIAFGLILFFITMVIFGSLMTAAPSAIVVERVRVLQAFGRSFDLCKSFLCFVFCTQFCFLVTVTVLSILFNMLFDQLPHAFAFIGHLLVNIVSSSIAPVINFVIYMAVRIRRENVTKADVAMEIGNNEVASAIEMQEDDRTKPNMSEML